MTALERLKVRLPDVQNAQLEALLEEEASTACC